MNRPVALFLYNRPDLVSRVFGAIQRAKPKVLLLIADGPANERDSDLCELARGIARNVNWDCEVHSNFSPVHLGCQKRVISGIKWVFTLVDAAVFLEDDILPSTSFFPFCEQLLDRYQRDERVFAISGCNFNYSDPLYPYSYRMSRYVNMWGWATWKDRVSKVDFAMSSWPEFKTSNSFKEVLGHDTHWMNYWKNEFENTYLGKMDTWDYQCLLSVLQRRQRVVSPAVNLVTNLGFRSDATHTTNRLSPSARLKAEEINFPILHPPNIEVDSGFDAFVKRAWADRLTLNGRVLHPWLRNIFVLLRLCRALPWTRSHRIRKFFVPYSLAQKMNVS